MFTRVGMKGGLQAMMARWRQSVVRASWARGFITLVVVLGFSSLVAGCGLLLDQFSGPSATPLEDPSLIPGMVIAQTADATFTVASSIKRKVKLNKLLKHSAFKRIKERLEKDKGLRVHTEKVQAFKIHRNKQAQSGGVAAFDTADDGTLLLVPVGESDQGYSADIQLSRSRHDLGRNLQRW